MTYLVVGTRAGGAWSVQVQGVGSTSATELSGIENAARALLAAEGHTDSATADLSLLLPDFEVDLDSHGVPSRGRPHWEIVSGVVALLVVVGAAAFVLGRLF